MRSNKLTAGLLGIALFGVTAAGSYAYAQATDTSTSPTVAPFSEKRLGRFGGGKGMGMMGAGGMGFRHGGMQGMPAKMEVSDETRAIFDDLRAAYQSGDEARVTELRQQLQTQFEAERTARATAMDTAISGGYESWKAYATEQGMPAALTGRITADNFDRFKTLHELRQQARAIEAELGFDEMGMHHMRF